jgi:hypothetical protein
MFWPEVFVPRADFSLAAFVDQRVVVLFAGFLEFAQRMHGLGELLEFCRLV